jgi:hypothetical protein
MRGILFGIDASSVAVEFFGGAEALALLTGGFKGASTSAETAIVFVILEVVASSSAAALASIGALADALDAGLSGGASAMAASAEGGIGKGIDAAFFAALFGGRAGAAACGALAASIDTSGTLFAADVTGSAVVGIACKRDTTGDSLEVVAAVLSAGAGASALEALLSCLGVAGLVTGAAVLGVGGGDTLAIAGALASGADAKTSLADEIARTALVTSAAMFFVFL